jgi:hypothetical protein
VLAGVSGAFGSNDTGANTRTQIYGADFLYKWKSASAEGGFPFVKWQTEAMYRRFDAGRGVDDLFPVAETFHDWGLYSQVVWGFKRPWSVGGRIDWADSDGAYEGAHFRTSLALSYYPSEFSRIRLQLARDYSRLGEPDNQIFVQYIMSLGAHGAHKF